MYIDYFDNQVTHVSKITLTNVVAKFTRFHWFVPLSENPKKFSIPGQFLSCLFPTPIGDRSVSSSFVYHFFFLSFHVFFALVSFIFALSYLHYHTTFLNMNDEGLRDHGAVNVCVCVCVCVCVSPRARHPHFNF